MKTSFVDRIRECSVSIVLVGRRFVRPRNGIDASSAKQEWHVQPAVIVIVEKATLHPTVSKMNCLRSTPSINDLGGESGLGGNVPEAGEERDSRGLASRLRLWFDPARSYMPWAIAMVEDAAAISRNWRRLNCSRGVAGIGIDGPSFNYEEPGEFAQIQLAS